MRGYMKLIFSLLFFSNLVLASWGPGDVLKVEFNNIKHSFNSKDLTGKEESSSTYSFTSYLDKNASHSILATLKICSDREINGNVNCSTVSSKNLAINLNSAEVSKSLIFEGDYNKVLSSIKEVMKANGESGSSKENIKYYHYRFLIKKQINNQWKTLFTKKIFPSKLEGDVKVPLSLSVDTNNKLAGSGYAIIQESWSHGNLAWEPGRNISIRFETIKHKLKVEDVTYVEGVDISKLSQEIKDELKMATFEVEARLKLCFDQEVNGYAICTTISSQILEGSFDSTVLADDLSFFKTYGEIEEKIEQLMKEKKLTGFKYEDLRNYHFRLNFYRQKSKGSSQDVLLYKKLICPNSKSICSSSLGFGERKWINLHQDSNSKLSSKTGYGQIY